MRRVVERKKLPRPPVRVDADVLDREPVFASQAGGLSGGAATRWPSTAQHTAETSSGTIQANIFRLLEAPITPSGWFDADGFTFFAGIDMPSPSALHDPPDDTVGTWLILSGVSDNQVVVSDSQGLNGRSALAVTVLPAVQLAIQRTDPYPVVTLFGESGSPHVLEGSTDLRNWLPLVTNAPAGGAFAYPDTNAAAIARRFYRGLKP